MGIGTTVKVQAKKIVIVICVAILLLVGLELVRKDSDNKKSTTTPASSQTNTDNEQPKKTEYLSYQGEDGKTALDLLKSQAEIQTKSSSIGEYVTSINGNGGGGSKYWIFYIDGKESSVGAGAYTTKTGETIEWKLK